MAKSDDRVEPVVLDGRLKWMIDQAIDPRKIESYMRYLAKVYLEETVWHSQTIRDSYRIREEDLVKLRAHGLIELEERDGGRGKTKLYVHATEKLIEMPARPFNVYRQAIAVADERADQYSEEFEGRVEPRKWSPEELEKQDKEQQQQVQQQQ